MGSKQKQITIILKKDAFYQKEMSEPIATWDDLKWNPKEFDRKVVVKPYTKEMMINAFRQQKKKIGLV